MDNSNDYYEAHRSGLHVLRTTSSASSSPSWLDNPHHEWPTWLEGSRCGYATVTIGNPKEGCEEKSIVILGGDFTDEDEARPTIVIQVSFTSSSMKRWETGPSFYCSRTGLAAAYSNQYLYVIGGCDGNEVLDTIERIALSDLIPNGSGGGTTATGGGWATLNNIRLSSPRRNCCAVTVHDRFIVVMGGSDPNNTVLSSVDIIDTTTTTTSSSSSLRSTFSYHHQPRRSQKEQPQYPALSLWSGPRLRTGRFRTTATVLGHKIWLVGGRDEDGIIVKTVESLSFRPLQDDDVEEDNCESIFSSSSWHIEDDLTLVSARTYHSLSRVGQCLVVTGGYCDRYHQLASVEVLDTYRRMRWRLPDLSRPSIYPSTVHISNHGLLLWGGYNTAVMESLPMVELSLYGLKGLFQTWQRMEQSLCQRMARMDADADKEQETKDLLQTRIEMYRTFGVQVDGLCKTLIYHLITRNPQTASDALLCGLNRKRNIS